MDIQLNWTTCIAAAGFVATNPAVLQALGWLRGVALRNVPAVNWKRLAIPAPVITLMLLALFTELPADAQYRRSRTAAPAGVGADPSLKDAVASFDGTLRAVTKKDFTVDLDNGNTIVFKIGKKTEFYIGDKAVKPKDLAPEQIVMVEGVKDGFGVLTATKLKVKLEDPAKAEKQ